MEREGVSPDVVVDAPPEELAKGIDAQLKKAVEVLGVEVAEWKKARAGVATAPPAPSGTGVSAIPTSGMGTTPPKP
jgi:C-terminal processing protease CtpA/Prc